MLLSSGGTRSFWAIGRAWLLGSVVLGCGGSEFVEVTRPLDQLDGGGDGASTFCKSGARHYFCDDFDSARSDVRGLWDDARSSTYGKLTLEGTDARSGPLSLFAQTLHEPIVDATSANLPKDIGKVA